MANKNNEELVIKIVKEQLGLEKVDRFDKFFEDLNCDDLDQLEIIMALEEKCNLEVSDEQGEKFQTPDDIIKWLDERQPSDGN